MTLSNGLQCRFLPITPPGYEFLGYCSDVESWQKLRNREKALPIFCGATEGRRVPATKSRDSEGGTPLAYEVRGSWCRRPHQPSGQSIASSFAGACSPSPESGSSR